MSVLLYVAGAIAFAMGAAMVGFGVPINEFSFGNTLIIAGTVAMSGGMIVFALGVVTGQLQKLTEVNARGPARPVRPPETAETSPAAMRPPVPPQPKPASVPFPPKPKAPSRHEVPLRDVAVEPLTTEPHSELELPPFAPRPLPARAEAEEEAFVAPVLPNPDEPPAIEPDEPPVRKPLGPPPFLERDPRADDDDEPSFMPPPRRAPVPSNEDRPERSFFDAMWPAKPELPEAKADEPEPAEPEPLPVQAAAPVVEEPAPEPDEKDEPSPREERAPVPILKSGVVDGMGYTLYVDGSIEAELPDGTLRFASINELRAHLEKTSEG